MRTGTETPTSHWWRNTTDAKFQLLCLFTSQQAPRSPHLLPSPTHLIRLTSIYIFFWLVPRGALKWDECLLINRPGACITSNYSYICLLGLFRILFPNCKVWLDKVSFVLLLAFRYGEDGFHDWFWIPGMIECYRSWLEMYGFLIGVWFLFLV